MAKTFVDKKKLKIDTIPTVTEAEPVVALTDLKSLAAQAVIISFVAFLAGYLLTTLSSLVIGYSKLPLDPNYPDFARFINQQEGGSALEQAGFLGTGLFIYGVCNALHWIMELKIVNFNLLLGMPMLVIAAGTLFFYQRVLPPALRNKDRIYGYSLLIALFHGLFVILAIVLMNAASTEFARLYVRPILYVGQILGIMLPSFSIILLTNLFYGAVVGGLLYWWLSWREEMLAQ